MSAMSKSRTSSEVEQMTETDQSENILDRVCIAMPCNIGWDNMKGNDEVRLCGGCNKNVYNISAMSKKEAEELLSRPKLPCIQIVRRNDGTLLTDDRPKAIRIFWQYAKATVSAALSLIAVLSPQLALATDDKLKSSRIKGRPAAASGTYVGGAPVLSRKSRDFALKQNRKAAAQTKMAIEGYPTSLTQMEVYEEDLRFQLNSDNAAKVALLDPESIKIEPISGRAIPKELLVQNWKTFESAREQHARASFYMLKGQGELCWNACQNAISLYMQAIDKSSKNKLDPGFVSFVKREMAKVEALKSKSIRSY